MKPVFLRLRRILLGYVVAAFASGACVLGGATLLALIQRTMQGSGEFVPITHSLMALIFLSGMIMVLGALPALAIGLVAEFLKIRHWLYYIFGGVLTCFVMWRGLPFQTTGDFQFFVFAGAFGGAVYWRIAGRKAGDWRTVSSVGPDDVGEDRTVQDSSSKTEHEVEPAPETPSTRDFEAVPQTRSDPYPGDGDSRHGPELDTTSTRHKGASVHRRPLPGDIDYNRPRDPSASG